MAKKKPTYLQRSQKDKQVNKKAILWIGGIAVAIVIIMTILLIVNNP